MLKRTLLVLRKLGPLILSFIRDFKRYLFWGGKRVLTEAEHAQRAKQLTQTLGALGPTFIKLAQVLSSRADVLPRTYIQELSTLQDKVRPHPAAEIIQVIEAELRQPVAAIFDDFDEQPLAAASLGQVHRARYHGDDVVIKVLRPGVPQLIKMDLRIVQGVLRVLNTFISYSPILRSLTTVIHEFQRVILQEIDFELEARNVQIFQRNFAQEAFVRIPKVYAELTTKKVVVLEYLAGVKINEIAAIERMGVPIDLIIQRLAKIYIHQVLNDGFLHADPHPGNIWVDAQGRIIILDFGMVIRIDAFFKEHLIKYAVALARNQIDGMVQELYELGLVEQGTNKAMVRDLAELMLEIQAQGKLSARKVEQMSNALMEAFYEFPFTLPAELVYIIRAASLIEGIGFIHDPWFDALAVGKPIIKEMAQTVLRAELQGNLLDTLEQWATRSYQTVTALQEIILKTDREQLRLRLHPAELQTVSAIVGSMTRKILAGFWAMLVGVVAAIIYLRNGSLLLLSAGLLGATLTLIFLMLLPSKKPEISHRRAIRKHLEVVTTADGEVYKSRVIGQMTPAERAQAEAAKQKTDASKQ